MGVPVIVNAATRRSKKMSTTPPPPPPPLTPPTQPIPPPPPQSFARRYRFLWPLLLTANLGVGAYVFMRTKKKDVVTEEAPVSATSAEPAVHDPVGEKAVTTVAVPMKLREPIPEDQQRELFKWLLEEKRKVKTKDPEEKKRIDEEKALLKQFIRAKSIPSL